MNNYVPFQSIEQACKTTGLSQYYLRKGCKEGTVPHRKSGKKYYIDINALLSQGVTEAPEASKSGPENAEAAKQVEAASPLPSAPKRRKRRAKDESPDGEHEPLEGQIRFR